MSNFKKQVISSSKWAMLNQIITQVIRLGVSIYMMRLLEPANFGVFMKVLAIIGIAETLIGFRLGGGIIQANSVSQAKLSAINQITISGAILLALLFILGSDYLALFYNDPRISEITKVSCIAIFFLGIGYIPFTLLNKNIDFKKIFIANSSAVVISSVIGIWLALHNFEYWSLVWQWIAYHTVTSIIYLFSVKNDYFFTKPDIKIRKIWNFSKKILYDDILNYGTKNVDNVLVGKYLGSVELGYYSRAYSLMLLPIQNFINVIRGILFPAFSTIKDEKARIVDVFIKATQSISFILLPLFLFAQIYTPEIVTYVLGTKWLPIVSILRIFLILSIIQAHTALISSVYLSLGRTSLMFKFGLIARPIILLLIFISIQFGLLPLVITVVIANIILSLSFLIIGLSLLKASIIKVIRSLLPIILVNTFIYGGIFIGQYFLFKPLITLPYIIAVFISSLLLYVFVFEKLHLSFYTELRNHLIK